MQKLSIKDLDLIPGIVQRGELNPELARRGRDMAPAHAQYLFDCARHEAAHVIAAWACPNGYAESVYINPATSHRARWRSAANAGVGASMLEHEAFISLAGPVMENIMALERGTPGDEQSRIASANDLDQAREECRQIGVDLDVMQLAVHRFMVDARPALDYMATAVVLLSTMTGELNYPKLQPVRNWIRSFIPHYDNYGPHPKDKMPDLTRRLPPNPLLHQLLEN